jgi:hypothetical protein
MGLRRSRTLRCQSRPKVCLPGSTAAPNTTSDVRPATKPMPTAKGIERCAYDTILSSAEPVIRSGFAVNCAVTNRTPAMPPATSPRTTVTSTAGAFPCVPRWRLLRFRGVVHRWIKCALGICVSNDRYIWTGHVSLDLVNFYQSGAPRRARIREWPRVFGGALGSFDEEAVILPELLPAPSRILS